MHPNLWTSFCRLAASLKKDDNGFVISFELVLISTVTIIGLIVGFTSVRDAAISEFSDLAGAVQDLNQCFSFNGINGHSASSHGSDFIDSTDWCDDADDTAGVIDNCITFSAPSNESGTGDDGGGDDGGGDDGGGDDGGGDDGGGDDGGGDDGGGDDGGGDDGGGDDGGGVDLGTPADGDLFSDNFQDGNGNAPFNLQVRNTTSNSTGWQAVLASVPYATIPGLVPGDYTLTTIDNGDGTYQHVFTGTTDLGAYQNVTITGGLPTPAGVGGTSNVDLFLN